MDTLEKLEYIKQKMLTHYNETKTEEQKYVNLFLSHFYDDFKDTYITSFKYNKLELYLNLETLTKKYNTIKLCMNIPYPINKRVIEKLIMLYCSTCCLTLKHMETCTTCKNRISISCVTDIIVATKKIICPFCMNEMIKYSEEFVNDLILNYNIIGKQATLEKISIDKKYDDS